MGFLQMQEQEEDEYCTRDLLMRALRCEMRTRLKGSYMSCKSLQCAFADETWHEMYRLRLMRCCTFASDWPHEVQQQGA